MRTAMPTAFPQPGVYELTGMHIDLRTATPGAVIHYTTDGTPPTRQSPVYRREDGLLPLPGESDRDRPMQTTSELRAIACCDGMEDSEVAVFRYTVALPPRTAYTYRVLQQAPGEPPIFCIEDFDKDKLYFVRGERRGLLVDLGNDPDGDLKSLVDTLSGGLPWEAVALHGHWDHLRQMQPLLRAGIRVYMNERDVPTALWGECDPTGFTNVDEGHVFDLGGCRLRVYAVPGHTEGCLVLVDERTGDVFASDALGNSRCEIPDSGWLQFGNPSSTMELYLSQLHAFRAKTAGRLGRFFGGHNHHILDAKLYLDHLQRAVQQAVDRGEDGLVPSLRSPADSFGSSRMAVCGDYATDLHWAGVNIGTLFQPGLTAENNALLSWVDLQNANCEPAFHPYVSDYTVRRRADAAPCIAPRLSSTRASLMVNGAPACSGDYIVCSAWDAGHPLRITVTAPDRCTVREYVFRME